MHKAFDRTALCVALAALLAACGGGSDGNGGGGSAGTTQSQFGSTFAAAFEQDRTAEPLPVNAASVIPVSYTTDPVPFP